MEEAEKPCPTCGRWEPPYYPSRKDKWGQHQLFINGEWVNVYEMQHIDGI
jgi:hypothetical protein